MTQRAGQRGAPESEGRHRSPWGRSGRILPIRWGRVAAIVAVVAVFVGAVGGLLLLRWSTRGATEPAEGRDGNVSAAMTVTASPGMPTAPGVEQPPAAASVGALAAPGSAPTILPDGSAVPGSQASPGALSPAGTTGPTGAPTTAAGPALRLSRTVVDLGETTTSDAVDLVSLGSAPVQFAVGPTPRWLRVTPDGGRLDVGEVAALAIMIDRSAAPAGVVSADVRVSAVNGTGGGTVRVQASVSGPPKVVSVVATPDAVRPSSCPAAAGPTVSTVRAVVEDSSGIRSVELAARMPDGRNATQQLDLDDATGIQSTWSGRLGPVGAVGQLSFTVTATDLDGLKAEGRGSMAVEECST